MALQVVQNRISPEFEALVELVPHSGLTFDDHEIDEQVYGTPYVEFSLDACSCQAEDPEEARERSASGLSAMTASSLKDYSSESTRASCQQDSKSTRGSSSEQLCCFTTDSCSIQVSNDLALECMNFESGKDEETANRSPGQAEPRIDLGIASQQQVELIRQNEFVSTISKLIDHQPLRCSDVDSLDNEQMVLLSNFTKTLFDVVLSANSDLISQIEALNLAILAAPDKKKRNEERIKFAFKRANKLLLKRFVELKKLESSTEETTQKLFVEHYFSSGRNLPNQESLRLQELIFKPRNIYRRELKEVFRYSLYTEDVVFTLESLLYDEYLRKRRCKILCLCEQIKEELYYRNDKASTSVLQKIMRRIPWSAHEAKKGLDLMLEIIRSG